jgi:hypothetical protein
MIRLWKVAGMWQGEDDDFGSSNDEDDQGMSKKDLVDGLIAAVCALEMSWTRTDTPA